MKDIAEAIKEKRAAVSRLQKELDVLERALALLQGENPDQRTVIKSQKGKGHPLKGKLNPKSRVGQAAAVLRENSTPLHIDDILLGLEKRGVRAKKASLSGSLARLAKRGDWFYRAKQPNTFGLLEWQKAKAIA